jgi:hypothetical protein
MISRYTIQYALLYKYQAFPFVPEEQKRRWFSKFVRLPFHQEQMREIVDSHIQLNKFQDLVKFMRSLNSVIYAPLHSNKDYDMIWYLVWEEPTPDLTGALLQILLVFRPERSAFHTRVWSSGLNLLFSGTCRQDKQAALTLLHIFVND